MPDQPRQSGRETIIFKLEPRALTFLFLFPGAGNPLESHQPIEYSGGDVWRLSEIESEMGQEKKKKLMSRHKRALLSVGVSDVNQWNNRESRN